MIPTDADDARTSKLTQLFQNVILGRRSLTSSRDGNLFIEALGLQSDVLATAHKIISSPAGLDALQASMRFDTTPPFLNDGAVSVLAYFEDQNLAVVNSGTILQHLLTAIVDPPFFWDSFVDAFLRDQLRPKAVRSFAWLLLQLVSSSGTKRLEYLALAGSNNILGRILSAEEVETRNLAQKIKHYLPMDANALGGRFDVKPGGRHDNDFPNHKDIQIMPTADEIMSKERPFLRNTDYFDDTDLQESGTLFQIHIDNQFRLLREDFLASVREDVKMLTGQSPAKRRKVIVGGLRITGLEFGEERKRIPWGITFDINEDIPFLQKVSDRKKRLELVKQNRSVLRHNSPACLLINGKPVAFPTVHRVEEALSKKPPSLTLQFNGDKTLSQTLSKIKTAGDIKLAQLDAPLFAFEPFLDRLQNMGMLPFEDELAGIRLDEAITHPLFDHESVIQALGRQSGKELKGLLRLKKSVILDEAQMNSLLNCLRQRISLVQGPPGTGKSFIGALVVKALFHYTKKKILVICFTNHAVDQFSEDLMEVGIPSESMVRLGSKSTERTRSMLLREQATSRLSQSEWKEIDLINTRLRSLETRLQNLFTRYQTSTLSKTQILEYLEFLDTGLPYFDTFAVPASSGDMHMVSRKNKVVDQYYLLDRWLRNQKDAGLFKAKQANIPRAAQVWSMDHDQRWTIQQQWKSEILGDLVAEICKIGKEFNKHQSRIKDFFDQKDTSILESKRIIACTTNGAAKYSSAIQSVSPEIILVEEAGEILEAHVLASIGPNTSQLIMIGDHKQLRPKCSYELGVESGRGYDLNRSLFERLILNGYPHTILTKQHRMRPEISSTIRHLTYPELIDASSTIDRPNLRGFQDNLIFFNHPHLETELRRTIEAKDGRSSSKQNDFEAQVILKCVRYLAQQGYGSNQMVVLTPYLGQLKLLKEYLEQESDPVLNDMDTYDLIQAGLLPESISRSRKPKLRISSIDNYQGEESDIVIVSLTRSNLSRDIGFMAQPERLNVLLSRARNALIMIGNSETFINARKGKEIWAKLFDHLKANNHVYDALPVKCERHPTRLANLATATDFEIMCPDGGCQEPCGTTLSCGLHKCPRSCHQLSDHSKMLCKVVVSRKCPVGHDESWHCHETPPVTCLKCDKIKKETLRKADLELKKQMKKDEDLRRHQDEIAKIDAELAKVHQSRIDNRVAAERKAVLEQKRKDLENAKSLALQSAIATSNKKSTGEASDDSDDSGDNSISLPLRNVSKAVQPPANTPNGKSPTPQEQNQNSKKTVQRYLKSMVTTASTPSTIEWQRQKNQENANNPAIDQIMAMIGLEDVKAQVLKIKAKVETALRQGTDLSKERLGLVLLGNPGTGKTTVARHYASVLTSLNILSGKGFVETTGSRLAHGGISEAKEHLKSLHAIDGGIYFIDEAYQLAEGHNHGGKTVLDFLLAEIENQMGKIVFVFAGYTKQMEKFFEHNPGFASRIPHRLLFEDYKDSELLLMLQSKISQFYQPDVKIDDGPGGIYINIAIKRLGRGRGREGFGNARDLENVFQKIRDRQAARLQKERLQGLAPDDFFFTKEDLIGPDPSVAIKSCDAWTELQSLIGLQTVKDSVRTLIDMISTNYQRELKNLSLISTSLNRVFLGSPGTGKTTVAKLYGQILAHIGVLSNGEVVMKNPADFIGAVIGESEKNTKAILANTVGKVLIIDEAYMLNSGGGSSNNSDIYRQAVIDTLVAEVQNVPGDDRCVLLCGYENEMEKMFQNVNPGLQRRFQLKEAFRFADFTDDELEQILRLKLKSQDLGATSHAISTAIEVLNRARNGLNFGNGGEVENLISKAKMNFQARQSLLPANNRSINFCFEPQDFDPAFDRASGAETNLDDLFKDVIGCDDIIQRLRDTLQFAQGLKKNGEDARKLIPMNFVFRGPPGTGKTTTARKFGQVFYDLGFLSAVEVVECSATDLIGQYIGQTGPKTLAQMEKGLGKVLFIDEAYRLAAGHFAQEAMDELVGLMTQEKFKEKMVIILAGYDGDMDRLLEANQGLRSRFSEDVFFNSLTTEQCVQLLWTKLSKNKIELPALDFQDAEVINLQQAFQMLSSIQGWGNARDIETLTKRLVKTAYLAGKSLSLTHSKILISIKDMLNERSKGSTKRPVAQTHTSSPIAQSDFQSPPPVTVNTSTSTDSSQGNPTPEEDSDDDLDSFWPVNPPSPEDGRDEGASDEIWQQLQADKVKAKKEENEYELLKKQAEDSNRELDTAIAREERLKWKREEEKRKWKQSISENEKIDEEAIRRARDAESKVMEELQQEIANRKAEEARRIQEFTRRREEQRLRAAQERQRIEEEKRRILAVLRAAEEKKKKEETVQTRLKEMGVCVAGFRWIPQLGGYRCSAGGHFVSNTQLGI